MTSVETQLQGESSWRESSGHDRVESILMGGYVLVALIAVLIGGSGKISALNPAGPENLAEAHGFFPTIIHWFRSGPDIAAAVGLLVVSALILYRRRLRQKKAKEGCETKPVRRFELPFLF